MLIWYNCTQHTLKMFYILMNKLILEIRTHNTFYLAVPWHISIRTLKIYEAITASGVKRRSVDSQA